MRVGVISDTHGLLRPEAIRALQGSDHILHVGDVGDIATLDQLRQVAPLTAIRGNIDRQGPCAELPATTWVEIGGYKLFMLHNLDDLDFDSAVGSAAIIYGHSHKPNIQWRKGVLYFNPGSAGPRRFSLPISVGFLKIVGTGIQGTILNIA